MRGVPLKDRVWVYDGTIIIEWLSATFVPTKFFLREGVIISSGQELAKTDLRPGEDRKFAIKVSELYEKYLWYREQKGYTSPIESRFKFKVILNKLRLIKNGWQLFKFRRGTDQDVYFGPLLPRTHVAPEVQAAFPVAETNLSAGQVDVSLQDLESEPQKPTTPQSEIKDLGEGKFISE